jgi:hypothetical protein
MVKTSTKPKVVIELEDPNDVKEIFASEVVVVGRVDGALRITLAVEREEPPKPDGALNQRRIIVARLVLGQKAARQLLHNLTQLESKLKAREALVGAVPDKGLQN